jgi:hypothetical protein
MGFFDKTIVNMLSLMLGGFMDNPDLIKLMTNPDTIGVIIFVIVFFSFLIVARM